MADTFYGIKNYLCFKSLEESSLKLAAASITLYTLHLGPDSFAEQHLSKSNRELYLHILFLSDEVIRFHYSFSPKFDLYKPNPYLDFEVFAARRGFCHYFPCCFPNTKLTTTYHCRSQKHTESHRREAYRCSNSFPIPPAR